MGPKSWPHSYRVPVFENQKHYKENQTNINNDLGI